MIDLKPEWAYGFIYRIYASFKNISFTEMLRMLWDNENSLLKWDAANISKWDRPTRLSNSQKADNISISEMLRLSHSLRCW